MYYILRFVIIIAALTGFLLSTYIFHKKRRKEVMVCPLGSDCDDVIHSDFSKFLGVPLEFWGMLYYGVILFGYSLSSALPFTPNPSFSLALILFSSAAFLFSGYLTFIQGYVLKQWCTWCLTSAFLSTLILFASLASSDMGFMNLLAYHEGIIFLIHLFGIAIGVGASTIADVFFFKFLKDWRISGEEAGILRVFGQIIWFALAIVVITAVALFAPNVELALNSAQFMVEALAILVIIINAAFLTLVISPRLISLSFDKERFETESQDKDKKLAFALGAISLISWYTVLVLASPLPIYLSTPALALCYVGIIMIAVGISQIVHDVIESKAKKLGY